MATIYLHAGMPKTGTSYIQHFLWDNEEALQEQGYVFPHLDPFPTIGRARNGYFSRCIIKNDDGERDRKKERETFSRYFDQVAALTGQYNKVILSEETLWNVPTAYWKRFMKGAEERQFTVKVIVYLRRQDLYIPSYWAQRVKEDETADFKGFMAEKKYKKHRLDYYDRLKEIESLAGQGNLIVRVYEREQYGMEKGAIAYDFLHSIGIEDCSRFILPDRIVNPSMSGTYLEYKRMLNANPVFAVRMSFASKLIMSVMRKKGYDRALVPSDYYEGDEQSRFLAAYADQNAAVAREYLAREDGRLFYEDLTHTPAAPLSCSSQELVNLSGEVILAQKEAYEDQLRKQKEQFEKKLAKKEAIIRHKQEIIDWETRPFPRKVKDKLKKILSIQPNS